ncbi:phage terminase small subunit P27 family [Rhizobium leucaenae]|uniref:phage terminase small subunit P27 family n=1 Tax=Rhizobium leucaenae TaxID=29450 RepID=UPI0007EE7BA6|nr:phage terminase small subunit P27 family [Rhizobium leucaenae]
MARGRKPDTAEQQAAKGAPGKRMSPQEAQKAREPKAPAPVSVGKVKPPKWLKRSRKATEIWNDLAPKLERLNLLHDLDVAPLGRYCRYIVEWIAADLTVQKEGTWFETQDTNGHATKKRHPAFQAVQDLEKMLRDIESTFGMRPDARYKIMRDQAAAHGLGNLPLFGDELPSQAAPSGNDGGEAGEAAGQQGIIGILQAFNTNPPEHLN